MGNNKHILLVSKDNVRPTQHGVWDGNLLCAGCDNTLGAFDDYALDVCRRFPTRHRMIDDYFVMDHVDGDRFAKFILSVLWRASISARPEFKGVSLGPYETIAGAVVFGAKLLIDIPSYQLIVSRYRSSGAVDPTKIPGGLGYTTPARTKFDGFNGWSFSLHGFSIMAKLDKRPFPVELQPAVVNGKNTLFGAFVDFTSTVEGKALWGMAVAHRARRTQSLHSGISR